MKCASCCWRIPGCTVAEEDGVFIAICVSVELGLGGVVEQGLVRPFARRMHASRIGAYVKDVQRARIGRARGQPRICTPNTDADRVSDWKSHVWRVGAT